MSFKDDILEEIEGEEIVGIVIGKFGDDDERYIGNERKYGKIPTIPKDKIGKLITWDEIASLLDYDYSDGLGIIDCHAINIWTTKRVIFIVQYDGSATLCSVPRDPTDNYIPEMFGE